MTRTGHALRVALLGLTIAVRLPAHAQTVATWDFNTATVPVPATTTIFGLNPQPVVASSGTLSQFSSNFSTAGPNSTTITGLLRFEAAPNANNDSAAVSNNSYFSLTLTPASGFYLDLNQMSFDLAKTSGANRNFFIRWSGDNFASNLTINNGTSNFSVLSGSNIPQASNTGLRHHTVSLAGSQFDNLTTPTTFRFYISSPSTGNPLVMDNLSFGGAAIPEPGAFALAALGLAALPLLRRRP